MAVLGCKPQSSALPLPCREGSGHQAAVQPHGSWLSRTQESELGPVAGVNLALGRQRVCPSRAASVPAPGASFLGGGTEGHFTLRIPHVAQPAWFSVGKGFAQQTGRTAQAGQGDASADQLGAQVTQHLPVPVKLDRAAAGKQSRCRLELLP